MLVTNEGDTLYVAERALSLIMAFSISTGAFIEDVVANVELVHSIEDLELSFC